uniref:Uncharacterized protein n=1 Tax=Arundo donax TaxID=35708 RepID=A0A0A9AU77_ARUDO
MKCPRGTQRSVLSRVKN